MSIAHRARLAACTMFAALNIGDSAEAVSERLEAWWPDEGRSLLLGRSVDGSAEEAMDEGSSSESELQQLQELVSYSLHFQPLLLPIYFKLQPKVRYKRARSLSHSPIDTPRRTKPS